MPRRTVMYYQRAARRLLAAQRALSRARAVYNVARSALLAVRGKR